MVRHYTEDVVFVRLGEELVGRGAILAAMAQRPVVVTRHLHTTTHFVDVQPGEAEAFIYNVTYAGPVPATPGATSPMSAHPHIFEFHDRYRKVGDDWQVARREAVMVFKPGP
jgi:ketosteroid isomerase-like protein